MGSQDMLEGTLFASLVSIVTAIACSSFGLYALIKNPHLKSSKMFILLASFASLTSLADFLLITAPDGATALMFARLVIVLSTLLAATMLYMTSYLPYERRTSWLIHHRRQYAVFAAFAAIVPTLSIGTVSEDQYGWWISESLPVYWWYSAVYSFYFISIILLVQRYRREDGEVRSYIVPPIVGVIIPFLSAFAVEALKMNGQNVPPMLSLPLFASSLCFAYSIFRQRLFIIRTAEEEVQADVVVPSVEPGRGVLIEAKGNQLAYQVFIKELASGRPGLIITDSHPDQVRERYGLRTTPILWLTTRPGLDSVDPANMSLLTHTTVKFLNSGQAPVVLLDGLEYLGTYHKLESVMRLVYRLKDATVVSCSKLIIAVDPSCLEERCVSLLEHELEPIRHTS